MRHAGRTVSKLPYLPIQKNMIDDVKKLLAIEEIKKLRPHYCRALDEKKFEDWLNIFTPNAKILAPEVKDRAMPVGAQNIIDWVRDVMEGAATAHHAHAAEITLVNDHEAVGIWALEDNLFWTVERPNTFGAKHHFRGFGHYHDKYTKTAAGWRISEQLLTRVYTQVDGVGHPTARR
ncbi:hypothetical protein BGZ83_006417 [Gryganskiella cystojenkinii]|nr:hypothetical protein BGZ83_006417 [Gryganskiella cystojenkinii]